jgi:hypothetical protein
MVVGWRAPKPPTALLGRPRPHVARAFIRLWLGVDRVRRRGRRTRDCASGSVFGHAHTSRRSSRCERRKHSHTHIFGGLTTRTSSIPQLCPRCSRQLKSFLDGSMQLPPRPLFSRAVSAQAHSKRRSISVSRFAHSCKKMATAVSAPDTRAHYRADGSALLTSLT